MNLVSPNDLVKASKSMRFLGGEKFARLLFRILKLDRVNNLYNENIGFPPAEFLDNILNGLKVLYGS